MANKQRAPFPVVNSGESAGVSLTGERVAELLDADEANAARILSAPTAELRAELARGLTLTAEHLYRLGLIWRELENRGEDLSDLRQGLARTLPLIASGRLAAEAVVSFAGRPSVLRSIDGLPLEHQRRLAAGEPLQVIDVDKGGVVEMPLARLPAAALRIVFGEGEVRTPEQQRLAFRPRTRKSREDKANRWRPHYNRDTGVLTIGRMAVRLEDLLHELSAAAGPDNVLLDAKPDEYVTVKVRLTKAEAKRLLEKSQRAELPDWELIRKALRAFGLI